MYTTTQQELHNPFSSSNSIGDQAKRMERTRRVACIGWDKALS